VDSFGDDRFCHAEPELFSWIKDALLGDHDDYFHLADFDSYVEEQARVDQAFGAQSRWTNMAILNIARIGRFSSDRAIQEYAREIWGLKSVPTSG
jgi:starch phosphorylase